MTEYLVVSVVSGLLFAMMDVAINANPVAQRLFAVYKPIARQSVNPVAGAVIDLAYGFVMAGLFLLLYVSLPGATGLLKGLAYACLAWFFRVVMSAASQWVMFNIPVQTVLYSVTAGLGEMLVLGVVYGLVLTPA